MKKSFDVNWKLFTNRYLIKAAANPSGLERKDVLALLKELARRMDIVQTCVDRF